MKPLLVKMAFQARPVIIEIPEDSIIASSTDSQQIKLITVEHKDGVIATFSLVEYWTFDCEHVFFGSRIVNWFKRIK